MDFAEELRMDQMRVSSSKYGGEVNSVLTCYWWISTVPYTIPQCHVQVLSLYGDVDVLM